MSTCSRIGVVNTDGSITSIYCHWDGDPSHHLPVLLGHYETNEQVADLVALGSLSSLGPILGTKHDPNHPIPGSCVAFGRDFGRDGHGAIRSDNREEFLELCHTTDAAWFYLFDDGAWEHGQP